MPICTNPSCGEISKTKTRFCPHCGQETLSNLNRDEIGNYQETPLTTEIFERETLGSSSPEELVLKKKIKWPAFFRRFVRRDRSFRDTASFMIFVIFMILVVFSASPGAFKDSIFQRIGLQDKFSLNFQEDQRQFKFLEFADNGVPAYFNGCGSIDYYVRQNYATEEDLSIVSTALSIIGSGIARPFIFKGTTQERDVSKLSSSVLIDFTSGLESKEIQKAESDYHEDVAGLGGPASYETTSKPRFDSLAATSGNIWIKQEAWQTLSRDQKLIVVMHEMGHVLGLTHPVNGSGQIMDAGEYYSTSLGSGDLMGLRILSALAGCREFPEYLIGNSSLKSSSSNENLSGSQKNDVYGGRDTNLSKVNLNRSLISTATDSCGNRFPEAVQKLNYVIPLSWVLREDNGCGSGSTYTWRNLENPAQIVFLQFSASVGWCQSVGPDDVELIGSAVVGDVEDIMRAELDSGRFIYGYSTATSKFSQQMFGVLEVGSAYDWCSAGTTRLEFSLKVQSDENLFDGMITSVFGEY